MMKNYKGNSKITLLLRQETIIGETRKLVYVQTKLFLGNMFFHTVIRHLNIRIFRTREKCKQSKDFLVAERRLQYLLF